jgi:hypothetical protein
MVEPRRWTLSTGERHTYFMGSSLTDDEVVEVIEAAPIEAELKKAQDLASDEFEIRCAEERTTAALTVEIERLRAALQAVIDVLGHPALHVQASEDEACEIAQAALTSSADKHPLDGVQDTSGNRYENREKYRRRALSDSAEADNASD